MFIKCIHVFHSDSSVFASLVNSESQILSQQYPGCSITVQYSSISVDTGYISEVIFSALIIASE